MRFTNLLSVTNFSSKYSHALRSIQIGKYFHQAITFCRRILFNRFAEDSAQKNTDGENAIEDKTQRQWIIQRMILKVLRSQVNMYQRLYNGVEERFTRDYLFGNFSRVLFFCLYLAVSIGLLIFVIVYWVLQDLHWLQVIARICGMQLNFNCALMLVLMLRNTARLIRMSRRLHTIIPVDDTITIHANIGRWIAVLTFIHAVCHMIYFGIHGDGKYTPTFD
jgi:hypothetical protein